MFPRKIRAEREHPSSSSTGRPSCCRPCHPTPRILQPLSLGRRWVSSIHQSQQWDRFAVIVTFYRPSFFLFSLSIPKRWFHRRFDQNKGHKISICLHVCTMMAAKKSHTHTRQKKYKRPETKLFVSVKTTNPPPSIFRV